MKKQILNIGKTLNKVEQKEILGGGPQGPPTASCIGTGTGGVSSVGHSDACIGHDSGTNCVINGYLAACAGTNASDKFWFY
ncbi:MAG: hypothetical protein JKY02_04220 [Flavobacteriaceae bacterium]|nr:hypothetical protein [Flavobacteriaceae bacterium]